MTTPTPESTTTRRDAKRVVSRRNKVAAARLRVTVDQKRGVQTPQWIRELAKQPA